MVRLLCAFMVVLYAVSCAASGRSARGPLFDGTAAFGTSVDPNGALVGDEVGNLYMISGSGAQTSETLDLSIFTTTPLSAAPPSNKTGAVGGYYRPPAQTKRLFTGNWALAWGGGANTMLSIFDPFTNLWTEMDVGRGTTQGGAVVFLSSSDLSVLVGGDDASNAPSAALSVFYADSSLNPFLVTPSPTSTLSQARANFGAAGSGDSILVVGGMVSGAPVATVDFIQVLSPTQSESLIVTATKFARESPCVAYDSTYSLFYVYGGSWVAGSGIIEIFDPALLVFAESAALPSEATQPVERKNCACAVSGGIFYTSGGLTSPGVADTSVYPWDTTTRAWLGKSRFSSTPLAARPNLRAVPSFLASASRNYGVFIDTLGYWVYSDLTLYKQGAPPEQGLSFSIQDSTVTGATTTAAALATATGSVSASLTGTTTAAAATGVGVTVTTGTLPPAPGATTPPPTTPAPTPSPSPSPSPSGTTLTTASVATTTTTSATSGSVTGTTRPPGGCKGQPPLPGAVCSDGRFYVEGSFILSSVFIVEDPITIAGNLTLTEAVQTRFIFDVLPDPFVDASDVITLAGLVTLDVPSSTPNNTVLPLFNASAVEGAFTAIVVRPTTKSCVRFSGSPLVTTSTFAALIRTDGSTCGDSKLSKGAIAGIAVGGFLALLVLLLIVFLLVGRYRKWNIAQQFFRRKPRARRAAHDLL